jgi:hypothetical protein
VLNTEQRIQGYTALKTTIESNKNLRDHLIGLETGMSKSNKAAKIKSTDAEKHLKQLQEIEKEIKKFSDKNLNSFSMDDFCRLGYLDGYINMAKDMLLTSAELSEAKKHLYGDKKNNISGNKYTEVISTFSALVNSLENYLDFIKQKFMPGYYETLGTFTPEKGSSSTQTHDTKHKKKIKA